MEIYTYIKPLQQALNTLKYNGKSIGFVPTMGALHQGHASLIKQSLQDNDITVVSIYVNPTQFNEATDYQNYPRDFATDKSLLESLGCDIIFAPMNEEMYPEEDNRIFDFGYLGEVMEGALRPGHFNGVAQIVSKLFEIVKPHRAYFGQKDFQQLAIIKSLVKQQGYDIDIIPCPIVREEDGLALSSRNKLLKEEERKIAPLIYQTLLEARKMACCKSVEETERWVKENLNKNPHMRVEYFKIVFENNLMPVYDWKDSGEKIGCIAVRLGEVRLIDNVRFFC